MAATQHESSQRIVIGPARALLLAGLGVQGAEPDQQLHVGKPGVPALPLAECDPTAELGDRFVDTSFERENGGYTPAPLGFEKRHLAGCTSKSVRGCIKRPSGESQTILDDGLVDQHEECAEAERCQLRIRLSEGKCPGADLERPAIVAPPVDGGVGEPRRGAEEPLGWPGRRVQGVAFHGVGQAANYAATFG